MASTNVVHKVEERVLRIQPGSSPSHAEPGASSHPRAQVGRFLRDQWSFKTVGKGW